MSEIRKVTILSTPDDMESTPGAEKALTEAQRSLAVVDQYLHGQVPVQLLPALVQHEDGMSDVVIVAVVPTGKTEGEQQFVYFPLFVLPQVPETNLAVTFSGEQFKAAFSAGVVDAIERTIAWRETHADESALPEALPPIEDDGLTGGYL